MNTKSSLALALALAMLLASLCVGDRLFAQPATPTTKDRIGTPGELQLPRRPAELRIHGVATPHGVRAQSGGAFDATFTVTVRNFGEQTGHYWLAATFEPGSADEPRIGPLQVRPETTNRSAFRIQTLMRRTAIQGDRLPIAFRLLDSAEREIHRQVVGVPFSPVPPASAATTTDETTRGVPSFPRTTRRPNLELASAAVDRRIGRQRGEQIGSRDGRAVSAIELVNLGVTVTLRNTHLQRWGYPATVNFSVYEGTPRTGLRALSGYSGGYANVRGNLVYHDPLFVQWRFEGPLDPGVWYTVRAAVRSDADSEVSDNEHEIIFMYSHDGTLVEQRSMRVAPSGITGKVAR